MEGKVRIAVGGSAANPPHLGHLQVLRFLIHTKQFDRIIWIPCGSRTDKKDLVEASHRLAMVNRFMESFTHKEMEVLDVRDDDVRGDNTPTIEWLERLTREFPDAEIWWFTGSDSIIPQKKFGGKSEIEACWIRGEELLRNYNFLILVRPGYPIPNNLKFPGNIKIVNTNLEDVSSSETRDLIKEQDSAFERLVPKKVAEYIKENHLYGWKGDGK
ncbi:MAG: nicotinate-nicotinamide nucleotide adenylyltransferase [Candidatus Paceibacterota bacterium]|jgi:nicotinate-nucleotide adenylyltransferase